MKKLLIVSAIFFLVSSNYCCAEDTVYLSINDVESPLQEKIEEVLGAEEEEDKNTFNLDGAIIPDVQAEQKAEEVTFFDRILGNNDETYLKASAEYKALSYTGGIFSQDTFMEFESGPIKNMQPFFVYGGTISANILRNNYHTMYDENSIDLAMKGEFRNEKLKANYCFIFNLLPQADKNFFQTLVRDDFITINAIPHHSVFLGSFRTPIGVEGGTSGYMTPFLRRSQIARNFGSVRGVGTKILGNYDLVEYNIGMTSTDRNFQQFLPGVEFNGLASLKPLGKTNGKYGKLKIGGGLNAGHRNFDYTVVSAHLNYKYKRAQFDCEYAVSNGSNGMSGLTTKKADGFNATASYYLTNKLQLLARYDIFNADRTKTGRHNSEYTAGINYFIKGSALKFMLNYIYSHSEYAQDSNKILLGTQIIL